MLKYMSKRPGFRTALDSQHVRQLFYHIFSSLWVKLSGTMSLLVICEILGLFVNTLTVSEKYFLCNSENLLQPI